MSAPDEQCWDEAGPHDPHDYRSLRTGWATPVRCPGLPVASSPLPEGRADGREAAVEALTTELKRYAMVRAVAGQIGTLGLSPAEIVDIVLAAAAPVVAVPEAGERPTEEQVEAIIGDHPGIFEAVLDRSQRARQVALDGLADGRVTDWGTYWLRLVVAVVEGHDWPIAGAAPVVGEREEKP